MNTKRWPAALGVVGALIWTLVRLPIYYLLLLCEPIIRIGMSTLALLGIFGGERD